MSYAVLQPVHLGSGEQGEARKRALERIAEREGFTWNGAPSIGRWLISLADREIEMGQVEDIKVMYSDDAMFGHDPAATEGVNFRASFAKFEEMVTDSLRRLYPGAIVILDRGINDGYRVNGEADHDEIPAVEDTVHEIWQAFDWVVRE